MRSAAATFDDDIGAASPPRKKPARKPRSAAARGKGKGGLFRFDKVARVAAIGMSMSIGAGILVNALMMQKGHHPAPLFGKADAAQAATPVAAPVAAMVEAEPAQPARPPQPQAAEAPAAKPKRAVVAARDAAEAGDDPIGRLLKGAPAAAAATEKGDGKTVLAVQKALTKLGFAVKANGTMGAATRKAIEAFEKNHNLPVKGEVSRRLAKALAAESGMRVE